MYAVTERLPGSSSVNSTASAGVRARSRSLVRRYKHDYGSQTVSQFGLAGGSTLTNRATDRARHGERGKRLQFTTVLKFAYFCNIGFRLLAVQFWMGSV